MFPDGKEGQKGRAINKKRRRDIGEIKAEGRIESERAKAGRQSQAGNLQGIILLAEGVDEKIVADSVKKKKKAEK